MKVRVGAATDVGRARGRNEDSYLAVPPLYAVADGMGGHRGGNVASSVAMEVLSAIAGDGDWQNLAEQVRRANHAILERARGDRSLQGMGTTITATYLEGNRVHLAQVGDSRAYLLRGGELKALTEDHTLVHDLVKRGQITEAEAEHHPQKSILTRALGVDEPVDVDEYTEEVVEGDRILLCSDGLWGMVPHDALKAVLEQVPDPQEASERLVDMANAAGGVDNITVVIMEFEAGEGFEGATWMPQPAPGTGAAPESGSGERHDITTAMEIPTGIGAGQPPAPRSGARRVRGRGPAHAGRRGHVRPHPRGTGGRRAGRRGTVPGRRVGGAPGPAPSPEPPGPAVAGRGRGPARRGLRGLPPVPGQPVVRRDRGRPGGGVPRRPHRHRRHQAVRPGQPHRHLVEGRRGPSPVEGPPPGGGHRGERGRGERDRGHDPPGHPGREDAHARAEPHGRTDAETDGERIDNRGGRDNLADMIEAQRGTGRARSGAQLALTILALVLAAGATVLVNLGLGTKAGPKLPYFVVLFVVGYLAGHLAIRRLAPAAEPAFFPAAGLLAGLGFAMIYRLDPTLAIDQAWWMVIGLLAFIGTLAVVRDHRALDGYTYTIGLVAVIMLLLPILPKLGLEINGARVWIHLGHLTFQPAEIGKVLIAVFLASYLNSKKEMLQMAPRRLGPFRLPQAKDLGPVLLAWGIALAVLFFEKDLGQSLLYFGIFVVMLWVATARPAYLLIGLLLFAAAALFAVATVSHVQDRVDIWLHATNPSFLFDKGFQLAQGEFAMATGGIGGTGLGQGLPGIIPYAATDFIFAAIGEELGVIGTTGVLLLFAVLVGKGLKTATEQADGFGKLLAAGLSTILGIQAFIIVGGITRVIPLTGVTLPFVSYGGSSLVSNFILLALLVRISSGPAPRRRRGRPLIPPPAAPPAEPATASLTEVIR